MHITRPAAAGLATVVALAAGPAAATVLTYSNFVPVIALADDYGDRVTAELDPVTGYEYLEGNGFTPNIVVADTPDNPSNTTLDIWNGFADLDRAVTDNNFSVPGEIVFTADNGFRVLLNSLDLAPWTPGQPPATVRVTDERNAVLFVQTYTAEVEVVTTLTFDPPLSGRLLRVRVEDFGNWAVDNINFDQAVAAPCSPGDVVNDGFLTFADVTAFINGFDAGSSLADVNGDGAVTFGDVVVFIDAFNAGCP